MGQQKIAIYGVKRRLSIVWLIQSYANHSAHFLLRAMLKNNSNRDRNRINTLILYKMLFLQRLF